MVCSCCACSVSRWYRHSHTRCHKKRQQTVTMSIMFDVYYKAPPDPIKEEKLTVQISRYGGHLTFREDPSQHGLASVCLTYEFDDLSLAGTVTKLLRQQGEHVEGPVDYGP